MKRFVALSLLAIGIAVVVARVASAQQPADEDVTASAEPGAQIVIPDDPNAPIPVPEPTPKALRYHRTGTMLWVFGIFWGILVPIVILSTGLSAKMRDLATKVGRKWFFIIAIYGILFTILSFVIDLPLGYYSGFIRQHEYGLSNQTVAKWWTDAFKGLGVSLIVIPLVLWVPYLLLRKSPRRWWLWTGLAMIPFIILTLLVTPIWVAPLFNKFGPMKDKALEQEILALASRAGIEGSRVFEVEKSVDTKAVNAYVTGFMNTKRVVLWDTILGKLERNEILFVMGHEMGHYVLGHVMQVIAMASLLVMAGLYAVHRTANALIRRWGDRWGFRELADPASLPLIILLFSVASLVLSPAALALSRYNEHQADTFGLEITRDNRGAALAFAKLQTENLAVPRPGLIHKIFRASHPPLGERIDYCNSYKPWESGAPLKYADRFK